MFKKQLRRSKARKNSSVIHLIHFLRCLLFELRIFYEKRKKRETLGSVFTPYAPLRAHKEHVLNF